METITVRTIGKVAILDLQGSLMRGPAQEMLGEMVTQSLEQGNKFVLINLAAVPVVDSLGVGALVKAYKDTNAAGGKLKLLHPSRLTRQLLEMTSLHSVLESFDDEEAALSSF